MAHLRKTRNASDDVGKWVKKRDFNLHNWSCYKDLDWTANYISPEGLVMSEKLVDITDSI